MHNDDVTILTDSMTSLHLIRKAIRSPMRLQDNKHRELLEEIVNILIERSEANLRTTIGKVKAHIGIHGNEQADKGAVRASRLETGHDITVDIGRHPYVDHYWPTYNETIDTDTGPQVKLQQVSDLKAGLKLKLHPICRLGYTKETSYTSVPGATYAKRLLATLATLSGPPQKSHLVP